jgi:hypothetical protein
MYGASQEQVYVVQENSSYGIYSNVTMSLKLVEAEQKSDGDMLSEHLEISFQSHPSATDQKMMYSKKLFEPTEKQISSGMAMKEFTAIKGLLMALGLSNEQSSVSATSWREYLTWAVGRNQFMKGSLNIKLIPKLNTNSNKWYVEVPIGSNFFEPYVAGQETTLQYSHREAEQIAQYVAFLKTEPTKVVASASESTSKVDESQLPF